MKIFFSLNLCTIVPSSTSTVSRYNKQACVVLQKTRTAISIQTTGVRGAIQLRRSDVSGFFEFSSATNVYIGKTRSQIQVRCRLKRKRDECIDRQKQRERRFDQINATFRPFFEAESFLSSRNFRYLVTFRARTKLPRAGKKINKKNSRIDIFYLRCRWNPTQKRPLISCHFLEVNLGIF